MKVLFVEPPKEVWFVMGEYLPPPYGIIQLGAYLEKEAEDVEIEVLDCNAKHVDWKDMEKRIESFNPDVVASSSLATCNTYVVLRTLETAKKSKLANHYCDWRTTLHRNGPGKLGKISGN